MEPDGQKSPGCFNWVSMLCLVAVLALVAFGIIPGLYNAREAGRRTSCQCHSRNVSTSIINYENSRNTFPGYANVLATGNKEVYVDPTTGTKSPVSWAILVLRMLDRPDLFKAWSTPAAQVTPKILAAKHTRLDIFQCPADPRVGRNAMPLSYVVNCGMKDWAGLKAKPRDWAENGVFFDRFRGNSLIMEDKADQVQIVQTSSAYISRHDGLQNTILMTENVDAGNYTDVEETRVGVLWEPTGMIDPTRNPPHLSPPDDNMRLNHRIGMSELHVGKVDASVFARPSSYHPGGANVVFCDSHLKFISDQIDYYVYCLLMSSDGQRVRKPGSDQGIPGFDAKIEDDWLDH